MICYRKKQRLMRTMDQVDKVIGQWRVARPDLDMCAMGPIGRLTRATKKMHVMAEQIFATYGLNIATFDVLSGLRRSGEPYALSAGELLASMMITSGTLTNRIDQLEKSGLVIRKADSGDARKTIVSLTAEGLKRIDAAIVDHVAAQQALMGALTPEEVIQFDGLLRKLNQALGV